MRLFFITKISIFCVLIIEWGLESLDALQAMVKDADWLFCIMQKEGRYPKIVLELWPPFLGTIEKSMQIEDELVRKSISFLKTKIR